MNCEIKIIFQVRILGWVAISFSRGSSQPRDQTHISYVSCISRQVLYDREVPGGSEVKASGWNAGDPGSIPGLGRSPGEGNGNPI